MSLRWYRRLHWIWVNILSHKCSIHKHIYITVCGAFDSAWDGTVRYETMYKLWEMCLLGMFFFVFF